MNFTRRALVAGAAAAPTLAQAADAALAPPPVAQALPAKAAFAKMPRTPCTSSARFTPTASSARPASMWSPCR